MIEDHKKIIKCPICNQKIKPILEENKLKQNFYGQRFTGEEKKYLLVCSICKSIINSK